MARWLGALTALAEDPVDSQQPHDSLQPPATPGPDIQCLFWLPWAPGTQAVYRHTSSVQTHEQAKYTHIILKNHKNKC